MSFSKVPNYLHVYGLFSSLENLLAVEHYPGPQFENSRIK